MFPRISSVEHLAGCADYSLLESLNCDPQARETGLDHEPRQVFSGHYVPVKPTPLDNPEYICHSPQFFKELGIDDTLSQSPEFIRLFSGDLRDLHDLSEAIRPVGWACGYALSIFGTEYSQQCPFQTGNGYGDGRAISIFEAVINGQRWEMQLKGGGRTPYCRGADGRAVLRSSVREFLAQEAMHALRVPTSRSLCLLVSKNQTVKRPWYSEGSQAFDPDILVDEPVAICTRVAPSFIRVGQLELFGRRARKQEYADALQELEQLVLHAIAREYADDIEQALSLTEKVLLFAEFYRERLASLVTEWLRVGYCQGNFNSDNCAVGGFTLDYGPFGFMESFDPYFQPWTGGGQHFSFWYQPTAAMKNFEMFCTALKPLLTKRPEALETLTNIQQDFEKVIQEKMQVMWASKMGLPDFDVSLFSKLVALMRETPVDFTLFFRELSAIPDQLTPLKKSFYQQPDQALETRWQAWLLQWQQALLHQRNGYIDQQEVARQMKQVNPKYILREWLLAPAYQQAKSGDYSLIKELQTVMSQPYADQINLNGQNEQIDNKYYQLRPDTQNQLGGVSHMSCSS